MDHNRSNSFNFFKPEYYTQSNSDKGRENYIYYTRRDSSGPDSRVIASLRIFAFIMLQSWRKSRNEIKQLKTSMDGLKKLSMRTETQLRVYGTLIKLEQNRTDELTSQLKRTLDSLKRKTACSNNLSMTLCDLKENQNLLEQELQRKCEETDVLNEVLAQTRRQLFRSMTEQRNIHLQLCKEQRTVQSLENEKTILMTEICGLNAKHRNAQESFIKQLKYKDSELLATKHLLTNCQATFIDVQKNYNFNDKVQQKDFVNAEQELRMQRLQAAGFKNNLHTTIFQHLGTFWTRFIAYPRYTLNCVHILSYCLLPAIPSPSKHANE